MIKITAKNHVYKFKEKIYLQGDSGCIGLELTGSLARLVLIYFDMKLLEMAKKAKLGVILHKRFIDDIDLASKTILPGYRLNLNTLQLEFKQQYFTEDSNISSNLRTMKIYQQLANIISPMLQWETDIPENHENTKLPVLDLEIFVDKNDTNNPLKHTFYQKQMSNKIMLENMSSMPIKTKKSILINEGLR